MILDECSKNNYDNCNTLFPSMSCPANNQKIEACGACDALFDFTVSNIRLAKSVKTDRLNNPIKSEHKETICYTRDLNSFFINSNKENENTKKFGDRLPQMYIGAHNGVFRIFPARQAAVCDAYDNRKRPWYIAASSGPKDLIIILDISGSMS